MDEQKREESIRLGKLAKDVVENEAFQASMDLTLNQLFAEFISSSSEEQVVREKLWATAQAVDRIKNTLLAMMRSGALDEQNRNIDRSL